MTEKEKPIHDEYNYGPIKIKFEVDKDYVSNEFDEEPILCSWSGISSAWIQNGEKIFYFDIPDLINDMKIKGCVNEITIKRRVPCELKEGVFQNIHPNCKVYVPADSVSAYKKSDWNKYFEGRIKPILEKI